MVVYKEVTAHMDPRQPPFDRPRTLGQVWGKPNLPRGRKVADLPPLPDWPPLPEERFRADWQPLNADSESSAYSSDAYEDQQTGSGKTAWPGQPLETSRRVSGFLGLLSFLGGWRRASKRQRLGVVAAVVISALIIVASFSLALRVVGGVGGASSTSLYGAAATQQATVAGATPSAVPTVKASPAATATASQPLTLAFTCASGSLHGTGQVCVHTAPSATLSITVRYCDGTDAKGLHGAVLADASGNHTWSWAIRMACVGQATATVSATQNGHTLTATKSFAITA